MFAYRLHLYVRNANSYRDNDLGEILHWLKQRKIHCYQDEDITFIEKSLPEDHGVVPFTIYKCLALDNEISGTFIRETHSRVPRSIFCDRLTLRHTNYEEGHAHYTLSFIHVSPFKTYEIYSRKYYSLFIQLERLEELSWSEEESAMYFYAVSCNHFHAIRTEGQWQKLSLEDKARYMSSLPAKWQLHLNGLINELRNDYPNVEISYCINKGTLKLKFPLVLTTKL